MDNSTALSLDDTVDGFVASEVLNLADPKQVTFSGTPQSCVMFGGGFQVQFTNGVFHHSHPDVVAPLRRLVSRNIGVFLVDRGSEAVPAATQEDTTAATVTAEVKKEAAATAAAVAAAVKK